MDLIPVRCTGNNSKRYDDKVWWEEISTIVEVNNKPTDKLLKSDLKSGDNVVIRFGGKSKKLFKGIVEFPAVTETQSSFSSPSKAKPTSPTKKLTPAAKKQKLADKPAEQKSGAILATGVSKEAIDIVPGVGGVGVTTKTLCDEMKINTLQLQLQLERQQRCIENVERKVEVKVDELLTKLSEIQKIQDQLASRQDQLFNKQDQIQSTLAGDFPASHGTSVMSWPSASPSLPVQPSTFSTPLYGDGTPGPSYTQPILPDVTSYLSDADLESILTFDWESQKDQVQPVESVHKDKSANKSNETLNLAHTKDIEDPVKQVEPTHTTGDLIKDQHVQLIDPSIVIQNNPNLCTEDEVGKLAVLLARESFFGEDVLFQSTVKGKGKKNKALDSSKLSSLLSIIHGNSAFRGMSKEDFSSNVKPKILQAIQHHCKYLRAKKQ